MTFLKTKGTLFFLQIFLNFQQLFIQQGTMVCFFRLWDVRILFPVFSFVFIFFFVRINCNIPYMIYNSFSLILQTSNFELFDSALPTIISQYFYKCIHQQRIRIVCFYFYLFSYSFSVTYIKVQLYSLLQRIIL